jgi:hypothetical protein
MPWGEAYAENGEEEETLDRYRRGLEASRAGSMAGS